MSCKINNILIGSDPEIFIKDEDGSISSAIDLFGGTKDEPIDIGEGCGLQEDNILVEFNTPPTNELEAFLRSVNHCKDYISTILTPLNKKLHYSSSELATKKSLENDKANVFGCSPSYNVVMKRSSEVDFSIIEEENRLLRSSGMHIHIGYDEPTDDTNDRLVLCFELFVTLPLVKHDLDNYNRRLLYGKIGDSRDKSYGVECRSLGGYFLKDDASITDVWNRTMAAIEFAKNSNKTNTELRNIVSSCLDDEHNVIADKIDSALKQINNKILA